MMPGHWLDKLAEKANEEILKEIEAHERRQRKKVRRLRRNRKLLRTAKRMGLHN